MSTLDRTIRNSTILLYRLITSRPAAQGYYAKRLLIHSQKIIYQTIPVGFDTIK